MTWAHLSMEQRRAAGLRGALVKAERYRATIRERFWARVAPENENGCRLWVGNFFTTGYGDFAWKGRSTGAHRVAWMLERGEIPAGKLICHHCDVKGCVNPDHLYVGSALDNSRDAHQRNRVRPPKGEQHSAAKLTAAAVVEIRRRAATESTASLAREFGAGWATVRDVIAGRTWKSVRP